MLKKSHKKSPDISLQFFGIILCLLLVGMVIPIPLILIPFIGLTILYIIRRKKKYRK